MTRKRAHVPVAERRRQLTEAALQVMRRDGAWSLTTRAVATEAGLPLGAVHYAYGSKAELIASVLEADIESAAAVVREALAAGGSPQEIVDRALRSWVAALRQDRFTELALQELTLMGARDPELEPLARDGVVGYRQHLEVFLQQLADHTGSAWDTPVEVLAEVVFAQFVGLAQNWLSTGDDALLDACVADLGRNLAGRLGR